MEELVVIEEEEEIYLFWNQKEKKKIIERRKHKKTKKRKLKPSKVNSISRNLLLFYISNVEEDLQHWLSHKG